MNVTVVLGTARSNRQSAAVAVSLSDLAREKGHHVTLVDVRQIVTEPATVFQGSGSSLWILFLKKISTK